MLRVIDAVLEDIRLGCLELPVARGGGSHSEQGGLFRLSRHICMEKYYFPMEGQ